MMYQKFGERVKALREQCGLNQRELAEMLGCDISYISRIENARTSIPPSANLITRMASALNTPADGLFIAAGHIDTHRLREIAATNERAARLLYRIQTGVITEAQWQVIETLDDEPGERETA